jgi:TolA-binding protein
VFIADGYKAYRSGDWTTALLVFKKAVVTKGYASEENYFMLVMAEMFARSYSDAVRDTAEFTRLFPGSAYASYIAYQRGRALHLTGDNASALAELTSFCVRWPEHELYVSALFWIAECLYVSYNFEDARALYQRIVIDYPYEAKAVEARHRIDVIAQRLREEKLLYLLKVTGEEYLAAKEEYEKQLSYNKLEEVIQLQRQMRALNNESDALKKELEETRIKYEEQQRRLHDLESLPLSEHPVPASDILQNQPRSGQ